MDTSSEMINSGVLFGCKRPELKLVEVCDEQPPSPQDLEMVIAIKDGVQDDIWVAGLTVNELVYQFVQLIVQGAIRVSYELIPPGNDIIQDESEEQ